MKIKKIIFSFVTLLLIFNVEAKKENNITISNIKYKTYDSSGNCQKGTLEFTTTYIYDIEEI